MAGRFAYSKPNRRGPNDPWFRVGTVEIGSAALLSLMCVVSVFVYALYKWFLLKLALIPDEVRSGQVWRIFTWPLANGIDRELLWVIISIAILWYFGSRLEEQVGRTKFAWYLAAIIVIPGLVGTALDLPQYGIHTIQLVVLLAFIAEYPNVRFFFGIPAWVLGPCRRCRDPAAHRRPRRQAAHLLPRLAAGRCARRSSRRIARGLSWIPKITMPHRRRQPKQSRRPAVVTGPWAGSNTVSAAQSELDELLDKISATGINSLSKSEKERLNELSKRLRGS